MERKYERDLDTQRVDLSMKHDMELSEVLERKNKQIVDLKKIHKTDFTEINEYYTSIILNNLSLINGIKVSKWDYLYLFYIIFLRSVNHQFKLILCVKLQCI